MLAAAAAECGRRAGAVRRDLRARFMGQRLRDELAMASRRAQDELTATLAIIRRDHALRGRPRRRRRAGAMPGSKPRL